MGQLINFLLNPVSKYVVKIKYTPHKDVNAKIIIIRLMENVLDAHINKYGPLFLTNAPVHQVTSCFITNVYFSVNNTNKELMETVSVFKATNILMVNVVNALKIVSMILSLKNVNAYMIIN